VGSFKRFLKLFVFSAVFPAVAFGVQAPNMRGATARNSSVNSDSATSASIRRAATSVIARSAGQNGRKNRTVVSARPAVSRAATNRVVGVRAAGNVISSPVNISRAAVAKPSLGRAASNNSVARSAKKTNVSRAAQARATAVFSDVSKIGGGYSSCRDSYSTCMDQFCAMANETYRRCFCSDKFTGYRDTAEALDTALSMLAEFQNTNLDAVNKTAAEVNAMYSASEGEAAIKRDTSASQKMLDDIADILAGKKTTTSSKSTPKMSSVNTLDLSGLFSSGGGDSDDIWGNSTGSIFSNNSESNYTNTADMEGAELYETAVRQCTAISRNECNSDAVLNLARSAYSVFITQDCNLYEKSINAKKESVQETVRTAEKYLREARLEEYRAHNSQDVNECLNKVETAIKQPTACGENYEKCLDYSGQYINSVTGEPVYSKALFGLNNLIVLNGSADVIGANPDFNNFLEEKKMFVTQALDTCRELADTVWYEFKRSAIIQIAQAQDAKIEEVKASCVQTIRSCYDQQTGALDVLGNEDTTKLTGAISAVAAHEMCKDQVLACAALYGNPDSCVYDDKTKTIKDKDGGCGLKALLAYVNTVDSVKVAQGCEISLREYAQELCAPGDDEHEYPWGCRLRSEADVRDMLSNRASYFCGADLVKASNASSNASGNTGGSSGSGSGGRPKINQVVTQVTQNVATTTPVQNQSAASAIRFRAASNAITGGSAPVAVMINPVINNTQVNTPAEDITLTYRDMDTGLIEGISDPDKVIDSIIEDIRTGLITSLSTECHDINNEGQLYWASSNSGVEDGDVISVSPTWMKTVFGTDSDLNYLTKYGFGGYKATIESNGITLNKSGTKSFGWGVCMKPTESQLCAMQQNLPNMSKDYIAFNSSTGKCEIKKDDWYKIRCKELGGYWSGRQCYVR